MHGIERKLLNMFDQSSYLVDIFIPWKTIDSLCKSYCTCSYDLSQEVLKTDGIDDLCTGQDWRFRFANNEDDAEEKAKQLISETILDCLYQILMENAKREGEAWAETIRIDKINGDKTNTYEFISYLLNKRDPFKPWLVNEDYMEEVMNQFKLGIKEYEDWAKDKDKS